MKKMKPIFGLFRYEKGFVVIKTGEYDGQNSPIFFNNEKKARNYIRKIVNRKLN